ncbi:MAG: phage tail tape measure protein, partial [Desulfobacterales bacterium]|nr:phage tail tape measure protein [Desulfobacterales bacterium]
MSKTINDATKAGGAMATYVRAFDQLGLKAEELIELSPEDQFDRIARAIANVESPTIRAARAQDIFGRAGTQLLPLFAAGEEGLEKLRKKAHELGIVFDQEAADKAARLTDAITTLKGSFKGVSMSIAGELVPTLTVLVEKFTDVFTGIREEGRTLSSMITGFFNVIVKATGGVLTGFKAFYISMLKLNKTLAETLIKDVEAIEYAAAMSKNYLIMAKVLPLTADALAYLNKARKVDIDLIEKEEGALVDLMGFFAGLRRELAAVGDAYKKSGETIKESVLPPVRDLLDVLEKIEGAARPVARSLGDILGEAVTDMTSDVYEYKTAWQETMYEILAGVSNAVGAMDSVFGQFHANEAQRLENEERQQSDALESWYERERERIERTIANEEEKVAALEALDEEKARKENELQVKMDKERRKLERKRAKAQKASAFFAAGINVAEAITKALTAGPLIGQIFAGIVAALGAIQVAAIAAAPLPSLKAGGMI